MPKFLIMYSRKLWMSLKHRVKFVWRWSVSYWQTSRWHKAWTILLAIVLLCLGGMYGTARWYAYTQKNQPYVMGVTFIPDYADYLGLNPQQTMDALINDLHIKYFRLVGYWSDIEPTKGHYDFSQLDWEFQKADSAHAHISLSLGLRQPRWPECHAPDWVNTAAPDSQWEPALESFITKVVERYKNNPALGSYQLENEFFNSFGPCKNMDRQRLINEFNLVKKLDPKHPIILTRSNNYGGFALGQPQADIYGVEIYRRVWNGLTNNYYEYPFPPWYYGFLAGGQKALTGRNSIITEFQAEPWPPTPILQTSLAQQNKSFNAKRFQDYFKFAHATGIRTVYFWGAEYWYYRMTVEHDPSVWNVAKQNFTSN